jgi:HK97 family phage major capsid protein
MILNNGGFLTMKMNKEDLVVLLNSQIKDFVTTSDFSETLKNTVSKMVEELRGEVIAPMGKDTTHHVISNLPYAKIDGDFISTKQGSVISMKNKQNPWVFASDEMQEWTKAFANYLKTGNVTKFLNESVDTAGGYLVPEEFRALMIMYDAEPTLVWQRATVWPMAAEKLAFPKLMQDPDVASQTFDHFAGVSFAWTEEGGQKGETEPNFGLVEMIVHELAGYTEITNTLLDDSVINLLNYLTRIFRAAWYWQTDRTFIQGTGGKQPLGILNDPMTIVQNRAAAANVNYIDIINMEAALPAVFDQQAVWFISKAARGNLRGQTTVAGELILQEQYTGLADGYQMTMLGRPAFLADGKIPALGTPGDVILGAWSYYYIGFRQDFSMDSSRHFRFRNNRTALRCSGRVDGQAAIPQAFVYLN